MAGSTAAANETAAQAQAEAVIKDYNGDHGLAIYITNNLPYIDALNSGTSAQAAAGYVETALRTVLSIIHSGVIKLTGSSGTEYYGI